MAISAFLLRDGIRAAVSRTRLSVPKRISVGIVGAVALLVLVAAGLWIRHATVVLHLPDRRHGRATSTRANILTVKGTPFGT